MLEVIMWTVYFLSMAIGISGLIYCIWPVIKWPLLELDRKYMEWTIMRYFKKVERYSKV